MPLEELLALYGYGHQSNSIQKPDKEHDVTSSTQTTCMVPGDSSNSSNSSTEAPSHSRRINPADHIGPNLSHWNLTQTSNFAVNNDASESDAGEDEDYSEAGEDWRRTIQVGSDYQAQIPDGLCKYGDVPAYENDDKLLWDPKSLKDKDVEEYLSRIQHMDSLELAEGCGNNGSSDVSSGYISIPDTSLPQGCHIRDDEQALHLLLQCGHKVDEALRRRRMQSQLNTIFEPMSSWSEEECRNFEEGLRLYGKDFFSIQRNKV